MAKRSGLRDRKPIDYAAFDSLGLDTLSPKVSPRAGHEGLPSPRQAQEQDAIKQETLDQASLIQQMNSKLERMVLENKRLEAAVLCRRDLSRLKGQIPGDFPCFGRKSGNCPLEWEMSRGDGKCPRELTPKREFSHGTGNCPRESSPRMGFFTKDWEMSL
jgi:hypothetical protein